MNLDTAYVESDDDTHEDRTYWMATSCPCRESCTPNSWGRVNKYSYLNEDVVRGYIREHLVASSLHQMSQEDAEYHAAVAEIDECTETAADRATYRQQVRRAHGQQSSSSADKGKGKSKHGAHDKRKSDNNFLVNEIKKLKGRLEVAENVGASREAAVLRHRPAVVGASPSARAPINSQRLQLVKDSIQRAQNSLAQSSRMLNQSALMFQERSTACTAASAQLTQENEVLSAAKEFLAELVTELR